MIQHVWSVLCSRSLIDVDTQNMSLLDVIEEVSVAESVFQGEESVTLPMRFEFVICWARKNPKSPTKGKGRLTLMSPSGKQQDQKSFDLDLSEYIRSRTRIRLPGLELTGPGVYTFRVELQQEGLAQWQEVASIPLSIQSVAS